MNEYEDLAIVGETIEEGEWPRISEEIKKVESCGLSVVKILNFHGGSTKYIAQISSGDPHHVIRRKLESIQWRLISPYYSKGQVMGFKVAPVVRASEVNAWAD